MENLSSLISKKVIAAYDGEYVGYVVNVCVDHATQKLTGFLICDEETENVNFIDLKNIVSVSEFVIIKSIDMLEFGEMVESYNPVGKLVLTLDGDSLGIVKDAQIEDKKITKLITTMCEINAKNIIDFAGKYLFFTEKKIKKNIKKNNFSKNKYENKVEIQDTNNNQTKKQKKSCQVPFKSTISFSDLIGKIAINDVFGMNNEIIIRKDQIITEKIIKKAKNHNKLNVLYFSSK